MGIDATKPTGVGPMTFKRIHVRGVENVDLSRILQKEPKAIFAQIVSG
jgi:2,5-furandicarboxylate decarboxylase 1